MKKLLIFSIVILLYGCGIGQKPIDQASLTNVPVQNEILATTTFNPPIITPTIITVISTAPYPCRFENHLSTSSTFSLTFHLPILTYHQIRNLLPSTPANVLSITVSPKEFEKQMEYLVSQGYQTIYFSDLLDYLENGCPLPEKPIILTFDDGWVEDFSVVYPVLKNYSMVGTFFPPTNWVDHDAKGLLSWDQISAMSLGGMEFGSHTESHAWLDRISDDRVLSEVSLSKQHIEAHTGKPVIVLAYPGGAFSTNVIDLIKEAGYQAAVTTLYGSDQNLRDIFTLHRIGVHYTDSIEVFASRLK